MAPLWRALSFVLTTIRFTLLSDGSSDRVLIPVLSWLLLQHSTRVFQPQWADLRALREPPRGLLQRVQAAVELYPCDLLFVHRDAEREPREMRVREIQRHLGERQEPPVVCVIPVRMQEAWLLFDEAAIRLAADNPRGRMPLDLPALAEIEGVADPKDLVYRLLRSASGLRPGRLQRFQAAPRVHRIAALIEDFSPLRSLSAFQSLEQDLRAVLAENSWL